MPSILDINGEKIIFFGSNDDNFYAINSDGSLRFIISTNDRVNTSPSFTIINNQAYIFFGSNDGYVYAVDKEGNPLSGWPIDTGSGVTKRDNIFAEETVAADARYGDSQGSGSDTILTHISAGSITGNPENSDPPKYGEVGTYRFD